jgi:hypothetical protein
VKTGESQGINKEDLQEVQDRAAQGREQGDL